MPETSRVTEIVNELRAGMSPEAIATHPSSKIHEALLWLEKELADIKSHLGFGPEQPAQKAEEPSAQPPSPAPIMEHEVPVEPEKAAAAAVEIPREEPKAE